MPVQYVQYNVGEFCGVSGLFIIEDLLTIFVNE